LHTLIAAIQRDSLSDAERVRFLGRIMTALLEGTITAKEGNMLTKLVMDQKKGR
jgi:D-serine dehydratase